MSAQVSTNKDAISAAQSFYAHGTKDKPRGRSMVKLRYHNRSTSQLPLGANVVSPGVGEILVYEDEAEHIIARLVEDRPDAWARAQEDFERAVAEQAMKRMDGMDGVTVEDFLARRATEPALADSFKQVMAMTGHSPQSHFRASMKRDIKPLVSAAVVEGGIAEPKREERQQEQTKLAETISAAVSAAMAPAMMAMADALKALAASNGGGNRQGGNR